MFTYRNWKGIVIHHSKTKDNIILNDFNAIKKYHIEVNHWNDIGYHFVIEKIDDIYVIKTGRTLDKIGAHALGFNGSYIGICCVGDYDIIEPSIEMIDILKKHIAFLKTKFINIVDKNIIGHRDTYLLRNVPIEKTCPGKKFDMKLLF